MNAASSQNPSNAGRALTLKGRLLGICALTLLGALSISGILVSNDLAERAEQRAVSDLRSRLSVVTLWADAAPTREPAAWDALAHALAERTKARVSFIAEDGRLLGDSELEPEQVASAANQRTRPEVHAALRGEWRSVIRRADEGSEKVRYVAAPLRTDGRVVAVARLAAPVAEAEELKFLRDTLIFSAAVALIFGLAVAWGLLRAVFRPARQLTEVASRMAEGDLSARARVEGVLEYEELGAALEQLGQGHSRALEALRQERDRLRGILSSMDEGVLFLDEDRRIALINPKLREMLLIQGDVRGRTVLEAIRHADLDELIDEAFDDEEGGGPIQGEIHVSGIMPRQVLVRAQRLEGPEVGLVAIFVDVTETRRLENLRREFVANVSHELRTPVTSVCSASETLAILLEDDEESKRKFLDIISRNAARMKALVEDLLDLSRIESRQFSLTLEIVEVHELVESVLRLHVGNAEKRRVELTSRVEKSFPPVRIDRKALEHVLSNLVDNAVKYAGEGKHVQVLAETDGQFARILVKDDGPGIEERHLPRLFERFYRVDAGRSRAVGGTGLGLSIVKNLVESMSGSVSVQSKVGSGTTFIVKVPLARGAHAGAAERS
ncbi:MAG: hypothetical protein B6A08_03005 [Sorangiineae bacterium NIC37A_2]|nr:MAG: hypothetical protein B6A08_03005 [Sorangiineae bacterium NIC37A_2]